jgi:hypothetical protein
MNILAGILATLIVIADACFSQVMHVFVVDTIEFERQVIKQYSKYKIAWLYQMKNW